MNNLFENISPVNSFFFLQLNINRSANTAENNSFPFHNSFFTTGFLFDVMKYILVPFLLLVIITIILLLIKNRYDYENKIILKKEIDIKVNDFLAEIILSNYSTVSIQERIKLFKDDVPFKQKWCKNLILNTILAIKRNINEINPHQMLLIYKYFGFQEYSRKLIKSNSSTNKLLAIYHYQILEYKIKTGYIRPYLYVKNKFLKSNALIATITLSDQKFDFLSSYENKISNADQLKILDIIYQRKAVLPTKINEWLYNENSSIVLLAIKLMIQYSTTLTKSQISHLFTSTDDRIRNETFLLIRHLYIIEANAILMHQYCQETEQSNKISALKSLAVIGNNRTKSFALGLISKEKDLEIKFEIINCINKLDGRFFKNFKIADPIEKNIINRILLHVNCPYLN